MINPLKCAPRSEAISCNKRVSAENEGIRFLFKMDVPSHLLFWQMKKSECEDVVLGVQCWYRRSTEGLIESATPRETKVTGLELGSNCIRLTVLAAKSDDNTTLSRHSDVNNGLVHQYPHVTIIER